MINEMIVVSVTPFSGTITPDKNGNFPVMLQLIAGKMPNRNVLSGTVAERIGIEVGRTYLMRVREQGEDKLFGRDFTFIKLKELETGKDIIEASKELSEPQIIIIERPNEFKDQYERIGIAVEGLRTKRIKEGNYIPTNDTTVTNHETAPKVIRGTSQDISSLIPNDSNDALNHD